jgi:hypothetical protein
MNVLDGVDELGGVKSRRLDIERSVPANH